MATAPKKTAKDYDTDHKPTWCPGCGDWAIWGSIKQALADLNMDPAQTVIVYGIGCSGNMSNTVHAYGVHGLHGRALPVAEGVKVANDKLNVIVVGGDGDGYGEGLSHFIHSMRGNHDITYIVHDNQVYGLTTGQTSPTSQKGYKSKSTPHGVLEEPINPMALALSAGCSFVSRSFAGDLPFTTDIIKKALQHKGFSLVDIFQPCATFNKVNTLDWYREHIFKLSDKHDPSNLKKAWEVGMDMEKLAIGVLYKDERPTYTERLPQIAKRPLAKTPVEPVNVTSLYKEFE